MKRKKGLFLLLGLLVLAVAFYLIAAEIARREQAASVPAETEDSAVTVVSQKASDVKEVTYRGGDVSYGVRPLGNDYVLSDDETFPVDPTLASGMTSAVASVTFSRRLEKPGEPSEYGLTEPTAVITASYADGASLTLTVGAYSPYTESYYASTGDGNVYLMDGGILSAFAYSRQDLLRDETVKAPTGGLDSVTKFEIRRPDGGGYDYEQVPAEGEADAYWRRVGTDGSVDETDRSETVSKLYNQLFGVKLDEWVDHYAVGSEKLASYGMNPPAVTVTVRYTETVTISGEDTSTVTKDVELVTGFLIGDRLPVSAETDGEPIGSEGTEGSGESDALKERRRFMLEGGTILYVIEEEAVSALWDEAA